MEQQPPWLTAAWSELGIRESPGPATNARITALFRDAGNPHVKDDETAWCAAFVGACLARGGQKGTTSLRARSYLEFGERLTTARLGAVAVFSRGINPALGHVGFVVGETKSAILVLGGNQANAVSVAAFERARLLAFRWPGTHAAQMPDAPAGETLFDLALAHVLEMEGGWSDDPHDPGGPTNRGLIVSDLAAYRGVNVTPANRPRLVSELKTITEETLRDIYHKQYWQPAACPAMPARLAFFHFDAAVNHGLKGAARLLQQALGVTDDGDIGPITLRAANTSNTAECIDRYAERRRARYRSLPHFWRFGRGWLRRVDRTHAAALRLSDTATPQPLGNSGKDMVMEIQNSKEMTDAKWWGKSMTIWGATITALSTVLPLIGPVFGLDVTPDLIRQAGEQSLAVVQAIGGLVGTLMTIVGRTRATTRIERRPFTVQF